MKPTTPFKNPGAVRDTSPPRQQPDIILWECGCMPAVDCCVQLIHSILRTVL